MFNSIVEAFTEYGWLGLLILVVALTLSRFLASRMKKWSDETTNLDEDEIEKENLKYNRFFVTAKRKLSVEIPMLSIDPDKPVRQRLFRDLLYINILSFYEGLQEMIEKDMSSWSSNDWANAFTQKMQEITKSFNDRCEREGMPDIVVKKFCLWHSTTMDLLYEQIHVLGHSSVFKDNLSKTTTFLLLMNVTLSTTVGDAERTLSELNGEITGLEYKGETLE